MAAVSAHFERGELVREAGVQLVGDRGEYFIRAEAIGVKSKREIDAFTDELLAECARRGLEISTQMDLLRNGLWVRWSPTRVRS